MPHLWSNSLMPRTSTPSRRGRRRPAGTISFRPRLERLEDRLAPAALTPPPGGALSFNGTSDFVQVASSPSLDSQALTTQVTLQAWVYLYQLPSAAGHIMQIVAKAEPGNDLDLQVETDNRIHFYAGDQFPDMVVSNTVLQAGRWYHVAATFQAGSPGQLQLFIDGVLDASQSGDFARTTNANPLTIGWSYVWPGRYFDGLITDVSVWNAVQTQAQIQAEMGTQLTGKEPGLVASWSFGEGAGAVAHDATANHNDGSLGNGVASQEPDWTGSLSGVVFEDFNDDGKPDFGEPGIAGVSVQLTGTNDLGQAVNQTTVTGGNGAYQFLYLRPGSYTITETPPAGYGQGIDSVGTAGGRLSAADQFFVQLAEGVNGLNYDFGERPAATGPVGKGQTADVGFWNGRNGQRLILALNGGTGTQLGDWLAATLPNLYGASAGTDDLAGKSNAYVARFYKGLFAKGPKLDAQVLATALSVYVTNATLDPTKVAAKYGFSVSGDGVGTATVNAGCSGAAFGVAGHATMTVMDLLLATNKQAARGLLYNGNKALCTEAEAVYDAVNDVGRLCHYRHVRHGHC